MTTQEPSCDPASFEPSIRKMFDQMLSGATSQRAIDRMFDQMLSGATSQRAIDRMFDQKLSGATSQRAIDRMFDQMLSGATSQRAIDRMFDQMLSGATSQRAIDQMLDQMLNGPSIREMIDEVESTFSEAALEQIGRSDEGPADPLLEALYGKVAHFTQERWPELSATAIEGMNRRVAQLVHPLSVVMLAWIVRIVFGPDALATFLLAV